MSDGISSEEGPDQPGVEADVETAFIVGAGVSEGSWDPVCKALTKHFARMNRNVALDIETDSQIANFAFAQHVHLRRFYAQTNHPSFDENPGLREKFVPQAAAYANADRLLKEDIAQELRNAQAQRTITARRRFLEALRLSWLGVTVVLTANWDTLLEAEAVDRSAILHLHGDVDHPTRLYLPSEATEETFRRPDDLRHMRQLLGSAWDFIAAAKTIWLYGISMSPFDAELGIAFVTGLSAYPHTAPQRIIISALQKHIPALEQRVRLLADLAGKPVRINLDPVEVQDLQLIKPS